MKREILAFDEDKHEYRAGGFVMPSVTQVIRASVTGWGANPWYLQRGTAVHMAIRYHLEGRLNWEEWSKDLHDTLDAVVDGTLDTSKADAIINRTKAAAKFLTDQPSLEVKGTEVRLYSKLLHFAGTIDVDFDDIAAMGATRFTVLADWKGTIEPGACDAQVGAYSILYKENFGIEVKRAVAVETRSDGTYKLRWGTRTPERDKAQFNLTEAERAFVSLLNVHNWKARHGLK
jgi:hypothetical protein